MIGLSVSTQRFSLYNLDEGEMFIKDFVANVNYYIESLNERHELKGIIYIGSRSVIFEPDDNKYSLVKFNFKEHTILTWYKIIDYLSTQVFVMHLSPFPIRIT